MLVNPSEHCQQVTPLGITPGAQGQLLCSSMASCSAWLGGRGGDGRAGGPGGHGRLCGGCGCASSERSGHRVDNSRVRRLQSLGTLADPAPEPPAKEPAPAEPRAVSPKMVNYYYLEWLNTPYHRRSHVVAT